MRSHSYPYAFCLDSVLLPLGYVGKGKKGKTSIYNLFRLENLPITRRLQGWVLDTIDLDVKNRSTFFLFYNKKTRFNVFVFPT